MQTKPPETLEGSPRADALRASPRMFDADWLDRLSRVHHVVPLIIFVPAIGVLLALGVSGGIAALAFAGWLAAGWLTWTLTEYWMHRMIFHFEPEQGIGARLHWIIHGVHHDHPNDPLRLVMPPSVSVPLASLFFGLFVLAVGTPAAYPFTAGFLAGYLVYDMLHYHLHHHVPTTRAGRWLRELHMRHHFQDDTRGFGISAPFWDVVFRTPVRRRRGAV
ncbi:MAG: sterol desaturase family protein [Actinomycetota bacterium]|nr:sterol desaturase family protein [Actinomycetota bacterium]